MRKLRLDAEANRGKLVRANVAGWSFILSVDLSIQEMGGDSFLQQLKNMIPGLKDDSQHYPSAEHEHWHFSVRLQPIGRSSVLDDWENLGGAAGAVGVPDETFEAGEQQVKFNPGGALHYIWKEPRQQAEASSS